MIPCFQYYLCILMQFAHLQHMDTDLLIHHRRLMMVGLVVVQSLCLPVGTNSINS